MKLSKTSNQQAHFSINCNGKLIDLSSPKIMGILNLTPDSFSDGGKFNNEKSALLHAEKLIKEGADFIDIGAQSTRPNAEFLSAEEEIRRIGNVISLIKKEFPEVLISVDTFYADVVKQNFEKLKIDRDFDVLSNEEEKILKEKVVNDVIEDAFVNVGDFKLLVDFFDGIEKLKANIFKVSNHLDTVPFKDEYIKKALSNYTIENDYYKLKKNNKKK